MESNSPDATVGCSGICSCELKKKEMDQIGDNISQTLAHPVGRKNFRKYVEQCSFRDCLEYLRLYESCCELISEMQQTTPSHGNYDKETFQIATSRVRELIEDLENASWIKQALEEFDEALAKNTLDSMVAVLENTKDRVCREELLDVVHKKFKMCTPN